MPETTSSTDISRLFTQQIPLLDIRAPVEFKRGAFPTATNLPLLNDAEREAVGKTYKDAGQKAAIALGAELVSGQEKSRRLERWLDWCKQHPTGVLYCYRGGLRSATVQTWLAELGLRITRVEGGYKRLRRELLNTIETAAHTTRLMIVAGKTGSGKTHLINALQHSIDLEGLANHRGSAFGPRVTGQPTQINFENCLGISLLNLPDRKPQRLFLEDESRSIGSVSLPQSLYSAMTQAPIALLEESLEQRVNTILHDYIISNYTDFKHANPAQYRQQFAEYLLTSLSKIQRRLGSERYQVLRASMEHALSVSGTDLQAHSEWIRLLLQKYYDPMYEYQLSKKSTRVVFRGNRDELLNWAAHLDVPAIAPQA